LSTDWTNIAAKPSAISAKTSATMINVTFEPLRDTPPAAEVIKVPDINVLLYTDRARCRRTNPAGRIPRYRGDDNWVPRTRDQEQ
jgi:hypothetical protein